MMAKFGIITPTIPGRERYLCRCSGSIQDQDIARGDEVSFLHLICGDGFTPEFEAPHTVVRGIPQAGGWGNPVREAMVQAFAKEVDYFLFVDDDNILLPSALFKLNRVGSDKEMIISRMLIMNRGEMQMGRNATDVVQYVLPPSLEALNNNQIGSLNMCVRSAVASRCHWDPAKYNGDCLFFVDCLRAIGGTADWRAALFNPRVFYLNEILSVWCRYGM